MAFLIEEFESKQFKSLYGVAATSMLKDAVLRTYEGQKGAELLLEHIKSPESDKTYWASPTPVTEATGERKQKKKKHTPVGLDFFNVKDLDESDFNKLAATGLIEAKLVYFSQLRCGPNIQSVLDLGDGVKCSTVAELTDQLKKKPQLAEKVHAIKIIWYESKVTTVDNRRLKAHREANVQIRYTKSTWDDLSVNEQKHFDDDAPASNINVT